jgi:hypothetical protein
MSSNPPDPETFQTDASHPLQGISLIGIDRFIKSMDLPNGQKLEQDEGGNKLRHAAGGNDPTSFPKNHGVNNQQVYSPRTTILANNQDNFDQSKVYVNAVTIVGTTIRKLGAGNGDGKKLAIKLLTGSHPKNPPITDGVSCVNAMGLILPTKYDPDGTARIFEVEGATTSEYKTYSLKIKEGKGNAKYPLQGVNGFTLHHDFGSDLSFFNSVTKDLTGKHLRFCVVSYILTDDEARVTNTYVDHDGTGFKPYYTINDTGQFISKEIARLRGSCHSDYRRDGVYDLQDEFVIRPIIPPS